MTILFFLEKLQNIPRLLTRIVALNSVASGWIFNSILFSPLRWRRSFLFSLIFGVPTFVIFITYVILDELERRPNQLILPGLSLENLLMFILCTPVQVINNYTFT